MITMNGTVVMMMTSNEPTHEPPEFWEGKTGRWWIYYDKKPGRLRDGTTIDWSFRHDNYDPTPWHTDGAPMDHRAGFGRSWAECVEQITEMEAAEVDESEFMQCKMLDAGGRGTRR